MFNEAFVEQVIAKPTFDITQIDEVLDYIFAQLPDEVTVYPTENYYYFKFMHAGVLYGGNLRLDAADRDKGIIHFAYFNEYNVFGHEAISQHRAYDSELGLTVDKAGPLDYRVTRGDRSVLFRLNDLSKLAPPEDMLRAEEDYIGPVFDESGVRMFLLWNRQERMFLYVLDESLASEQHFQSAASPQVTIGMRTGFAYYADRYVDRRILVGVLSRESEVNSFYDGPFDQLPDNFVKADELRTAFLAISPDVEGEIDRFGNSLDLSGRMLADPYILYSSEDELSVFDQCAAAAADVSQYYPCFSIGQTE